MYQKRDRPKKAPSDGQRGPVDPRGIQILSIIMRRDSGDDLALFARVYEQLSFRDNENVPKNVTFLQYTLILSTHKMEVII